MALCWVTARRVERAHPTVTRLAGYASGLVVVQVAATLVLLVAAGLMLRTLANLRALDLGCGQLNRSLLLRTRLLDCDLTILLGALAVMGDQTALNAAAAGDIWVAYPMNPAPGNAWVPYAWVALGLLGTLVQMFVTGGQSGRVVKPNKKKKPAE